MQTPIVSEIPVCNCKDCGKPMEVAKQAAFRGSPIIIVTCWNPQCLLATVTLSIEQYSRLTDAQFEAYREMNRTRAMGRHVVGMAQNG